MTTVPYLTPTGMPTTIKAGFFTRQGGVSQGVFSSLRYDAIKAIVTRMYRKIAGVFVKAWVLIQQHWLHSIKSIAIRSSQLKNL